MSDKLRLTTQEEAALLSITTNEWLSGPSGFMFSDVQRIAQLAVMEFLANEQGLTIYPAVLEAIEQQEKDNDG